MAEAQDKLISVADEYAEAALALAEEQGVTDRFYDELHQVVSFLQSDPALGDFMSSPVVDRERRKEILDKALRGRVHDLVLNTVLVLNDKGRAGLVPLVHERFRLLLEQKRNEVDVYVTSAVPLTDAHRNRLSEMVQSRLGRRARFMEKVDPRVIAGLRIQVDDFLLDDTAERHLSGIRSKLHQRSWNELHKRIGHNGH